MQVLAGVESGGGVFLPSRGESSQRLRSPTALLLVNPAFVNSLPSYQNCGIVFLFWEGQEPTLIILVCPLFMGEHLVK